MDFQFTFNLTDLLNLMVAAGALFISYCTWKRQNNKDKEKERRNLKIEFRTKKQWFLISGTGTSYYHTIVVSMVNDCENPISLLKGELMVFGSEGGVSNIIPLSSAKLRNKIIAPGELHQAGIDIDDSLKKHLGSRIRIRIYDTFEKTYLSEIDFFNIEK